MRLTIMDTNRPLVFISCGQVTEREKQLGKQISALVKDAGYTAFFAENQSDLNGLNQNILGALNKAKAIVFVMHRRGIVTDHYQNTWHRGSVWVEQEIAIAAFLQQIMKHDLKVCAYIERDIKREGIRDLLHLNPVHFENEDEVLQDVKSKLKGWVIQKDFGVLLTAALSRREQQFQFFQVAVGIRASKRYSRWAVELSLPAAALSHDTASYIVEVGGRPGQRVFRITEKHQPEIYPGDTSLMTFDCTYALSRPEEALDAPVQASAYVDDQNDIHETTLRELLNLQKPTLYEEVMKGLVNLPKR
jgi:hypothetical protein